MKKNKYINQRALKDIIESNKSYKLYMMLGWQDILQRYRRSVLGPLWLTLSMGVMIGTMGLVFGNILNAPISEYFPFLAVGLILWTFISTVISEGCTVFISADSLIKQLPLPIFMHVLRMIWRNIAIFFHNMIIFLVILIFTPNIFITKSTFLFFPGFIILILNLLWISLILGILCTRYRDLPQIINSILQVLFYITPIVWLPNLMKGRASAYFLDLNPMFHLMDVVRSPLLGGASSLVSWQVVIAMAIIGWLLAILVFTRYRARIAYWL
ncbi:ABC transporter permease [Polynucleobacter sp. UB-Raua-W9]|uniref:ABC transporter permease n=1 Tax=Polynucleobacter sp. UB-Raua-W9 TaxID=1819736 RepID=UPI00203E333B|nr:ABC transporter permease [Polynucleobacter sp. UB-Raua-W9]QWD72717.1 ABC transporter permease [Polynucleobacter sp. UB-Raua-W9]